MCFFFPSHGIYIMLHSFWCNKQHTHFSPHSNHTRKPNYVHIGFEVLKQKPENKLEGQIQNPTARGYMLMYERFAPFYTAISFSGALSSVRDWNQCLPCCPSVQMPI